MVRFACQRIQIQRSQLAKADTSFIVQPPCMHILGVHFSIFRCILMSKFTILQQ